MLLSFTAAAALISFQAKLRARLNGLLGCCSPYFLGALVPLVLREGIEV